MLTGNIGEWSEPYALLKLLSDKKIHLGGDNFEKIENVYYPILKIIRNEKDRNVDFTYEDDLILVTDGNVAFKIPIYEFVEKTKICLNELKTKKKTKGAFSMEEIEHFLNSFSINSLKAKSKLKNDITIQIEDSNTVIMPTLGFSVKSQLGRPATLLNASGATNFTYIIKGNHLNKDIISRIDAAKLFSKKMEIIKDSGATLEFEKADNEIFTSNLQTIDFNFGNVLAEVILMFYENDISSENTIAKFITKIEERNPIGYNLSINSKQYEMMMKKFLTDYALGMRASEVWTRDYQATGGYLIVKNDGELICYHFYFTKNFENYLYLNTKLETGDMKKHNFGKIYEEDTIQKIKLNLQIRFIK
ncbi:MAG: HpaII family restriction endonuclease [Flavobacterium sp.]|uniref:HpaII family restriction endonuclease n=1 Tax=Flavobacterium sp. TaxID=239 RepID=UPI002FDAEFC0|nr:HpaII family restriction endonuclease [Bacteroidota bacterium]